MAKSWQVIGTHLESLSTTTITASSENASFPVRNLADGDRYTLWKANASGAQWARFDLGSAKSVAAIAWANHNRIAAAWSGVKVQKSNDNFVANIVDVATLAFDKPGGGNITDAEDYFSTLTVNTERYWRLLIGGSTAAPQIGELFLASTVNAFEDPNVTDLEEEPRPQVLVDRGMNGAPVVEEVGRESRIVRMRWDMMPGADARNLVGALGSRDILGTGWVSATKGGVETVVYAARDDFGTGVNGRGYFVRLLHPVRLREFHADTFQVNLELEEDP